MTVIEISEREFQGRVIDLAQTVGWLVAHFHDSRRQVTRKGTGERFWVGDQDAVGFPDLVLVRDRVVYAELKREKGRLRPEQIAWQAALLAAGAEHHVWRPSDWPAIERLLMQRRRFA